MTPDRPHLNRPVMEMADVTVASIQRPDLLVLEGVNWSVRRGEFWLVGGLPASGKSDLLATAGGLMRPVRGVHRLFDQETAHLDEHERLQTQLRVGFVFGNGGRLFSNLSLAENLALPLCYHQNCVPNSCEPRIDAVLEALDLTAAAQQRPSALTRNSRQRAALARALVLSPELLFLDNPLIGVDRREGRWTMDYLQRLLQGDPLLGGIPTAVVVGTDDFEPWGHQGRLFAAIHEGQFIALGSGADLPRLANPGLRELLPAAWLRP